MKQVSRNKNNLFFLFLMLIVLLLSGCPKKVSPLGKKSQYPPIVDERSPAEEDGKRDANFGEGVTSIVEEEEISATTPGATGEEPITLSLPSSSGGTSSTTAILSDIFFDYGQWSVRPADVPILEKNAKWLLENPLRKVEVEGHADKRGTNEYNLVLAEKRANSVQEYLVQLGVESSKILVISFGEERPFCKTEDEACFQENRRAHFHVE